MIIRSEKLGRGNFTQIDNAVIYDKRIAGIKFSILMYALSKPIGWSVRTDDIAQFFDISEKTARRYISDLIKLGYMARFKILRNGKVVEWRIDTFETPDLNQYFKDGEVSDPITVELGPIPGDKIVQVDFYAESTSGSECENCQKNDAYAELNSRGKQSTGWERSPYNNIYKEQYDKEKEREGAQDDHADNDDSSSLSHFSLNDSDGNAGTIQAMGTTECPTAPSQDVLEALADCYGKLRQFKRRPQSVMQLLTDCLSELAEVDPKYATVDGIQELSDSWYRDDWRGQKGSPPSNCDQLVAFAEKDELSHRQPSTSGKPEILPFNKWCLKEYQSDVMRVICPKFRVSETEVRERYDQYRTQSTQPTV